jgi:septum site-determining protein MinD
VGKTTTSAAFASGLALRGFKTAVIDFDVGLRNLDLIMGCERRVVYDFVNVINGEAKLNQARQGCADRGRRRDRHSRA